MFKIYDGRTLFYQWDLDRKLIIDDSTIEQVHFCNRTGECSIVCYVYEEEGQYLVNVPNILLQTARPINVYAYDENYTKYSTEYEVVRRSKPENYVYTETEVYRWEQLEERIAQIEEDGISEVAVGEAVTEYMDNNNFFEGYYTSGETNTAIQQAINENIEGLATEAYVDTAISTVNNKGGLSANGYITDETNIDTLADGIYQYNGHAHNNIICSVGLPFINKNGIWIKKTPYNTATAISGNRTDTVIDNETGDIYTLYGYSGEWNVNKTKLTAEEIGARPSTWMPTAAQVGAIKNTGDTMKGQLSIAANNSQTPFVITNTAAGTANIGTSAEGKYKYLAWLSTQNNTDDLYLSSNCTGEHHERKLIHTGNIYDHALNKAGGTVKGSISISPTDKCTLGLVADKNGVTFLSYNNWNKRRFLSIPAESMKTDNPYYDKLQYVDMDTDGNGTVGRYDILHTGNKPSGSYTGNGEATERTINTGGIGNCCVVYGSTDHVAYLIPKGAFFHSGGVMAFTSDVSFSNGVIRIRNAYIINTANITYNYQVL